MKNGVGLELLLKRLNLAPKILFYFLTYNRSKGSEIFSESKHVTSYHEVLLGGKGLNFFLKGNLQMLLC